MKRPSSPKAIRLVVFFTVFMDLVGFGIIIPIQPFYAEEFGASPTTVTLLGATYSLMQFIFIPIWGKLSDAYGRRPIMLVSIVFAALGYLVFGLAQSLLILFMARMISGFGTANIATAQAIMADVTGPEERAKAMGLIGAAIGVGFVVGPALGGFFGQWGAELPAFVAAGLSAINFGLAYVLLPETSPREADKKEATRSGLKGRLASFKGAFDRKELGILFMMLLVLTVGFALMEQALALYIEKTEVGQVTTPESMAKAAELTAYVLVVVGFVMVIVQGGLIGRLVKRYGEKKLLIWGIIIKAVSLAIIPLSQTIGYAWLFVFAFLTALGGGILNPSLNSLVSKAARADEQGLVLGTSQSFSSLGRVIGPAMAGVLFECAYAMPFLVGAALVASTLTGWFMLRKISLTGSS